MPLIDYLGYEVPDEEPSGLAGRAFYRNFRRTAEHLNVLETFPPPPIAEVVTTTVDLVMEDQHRTVLADTNGGPIQITLPPVTANAPWPYTIKNIGTGRVTIVTLSGAVIDNVSSLIIDIQWHFYVFESDGTDWFIVGKGL